MPRTPLKIGPDLGICLETDRTVFVPGETIVGQVFRLSPAVSPTATINVSFHGRSKSKMIIRRGNKSTTYRGRFNFTNPAGSPQTIYHGPIHIPAGGEMQTWPFSVTIPKYANSWALVPGVTQQHSYISLDPKDIAKRDLPMSFALEHYGFNTNMEGFVEYFIQADLGSTQGHWDAFFPVLVNKPTLGPPITDFGLSLSQGPQAFASYRLVPELKEAELTFKQKSKKFFGSPKVPTFIVNVELRMPTIMQVSHPSASPLLIRALPEWNQTSEVLRNIPQKIRLTRLEMTLRSTTQVKCEGSFDAHHEEKTFSSNMIPATAIPELGEPVYIPCEKRQPPLNIGQTLNLRLPPDVWPSFTTYNIMHSHRIDWEMTVHVEKESVELSGKTNLTVLAPNYDVDAPAQDSAGPSGVRTATMEPWMQPPPEEQPPPTFAEVQQEDIMANKATGKSAVT